MRSVADEVSAAAHAVDAGPDGEAVCVRRLEALLGLKQSTVSCHLKQLLDAGIVEREKRRLVPVVVQPRRGRARAGVVLLGYAPA